MHRLNIEMTKAGRRAFWILPMIVVVLALRYIPMGIEKAFPGVLYHLPERNYALYAHMTFSAFAMFTMPFQFWTRLRMQKPQVHRVMGRIYALSILIGGSASIPLAMSMQISGLGVAGFFIGNIVWITVTAIAIGAAMTGNLIMHRKWIVYSAAMTFAAVMIRVELPLYRELGMKFADAYALVGWTCWTLNLLAVWIYTQRRRIFSGLRSSARL